MGLAVLGLVGCCSIFGIVPGIVMDVCTAIMYVGLYLCFRQELHCSFTQHVVQALLNAIGLLYQFPVPLQLCLVFGGCGCFRVWCMVVAGVSERVGGVFGPCTRLSVCTAP